MKTCRAKKREVVSLWLLIMQNSYQYNACLTDCDNFIDFIDATKYKYAHLTYL